MNIPQTEAIERYKMARDELRARFPDQWNFVVSLCSSLPNRIDTDAVWRFGRDKPCYSHIKVLMGERIAQDIPRGQDLASWRKIASTEWSITMRNVGPRWRSNDNFDLSGRAVANFVAGLERGGLKSYIWRLYAIRELALALQNESVAPCIEELVHHVDATGLFPLERHRSWTIKFGRLAGRGWGHTTAYHLLTDLGLSVKPDIHLTKSVVRMGLLAPNYPSDLPNDTLERIVRENTLQHLAATAANELSLLINPTAYPANPRSRTRELDKVLMEWSRQGLARPL